MSIVRPAYMTRYGYRWWDAIRAEWWWRIEHSPFDPYVFAYRHRKDAERRGYTNRRAM